MESTLSFSRQFTGTPLKYLESKWFEYNVTRLKTPTSKRQPVGYFQAWPRIWTRDDWEQIQLAVRAVLKPGTARLRVWSSDRSATLPPPSSCCHTSSWNNSVSFSSFHVGCPVGSELSWCLHQPWKCVERSENFWQVSNLILYRGFNKNWSSQQVWKE